ncbi:hypothetical protein [Floccifex sp.]|uniref:hypothetical protein n=1 Tax=Floccifex sp. TaxID=2815810 RepID=UPI002A759F80|nr:hypothetical protein [Floccifex sp.]MDD7280876.1 hypothetical protein [Erysipelotrichaceae bacterium]MDY2958037.1 hypothetical protein [Floccifex sp.]
MMAIGIIAILEALYIAYLKNKQSNIIEKLTETIKDLVSALNQILEDYQIKDVDKYLKHIRNAKIEVK